MVDYHLKEFFSQYSEDFPEGHFYRVIPLHEAPDMEWKQIQESLPSTCKGWFELALLAPQDRVEFVRDFWLMKMRAYPDFNAFAIRFFSKVSQVSIFLTKKLESDPWECHLVYSMQGDSSFFRGSPGATDEQLAELKKLFPDVMMPRDYLDFLQIHNGFKKTTDCTGIIPIRRLKETYEDFQAAITEREIIIKTPSGNLFDPKGIIPFYESFGMPYFQCFWNDWHPDEEMGNVYFSFLEHNTLDCELTSSRPEQMAFATFGDWLIFYLEKFA